METIKEMAIKIIGEIPNTGLWIQDIVIILLLLTIASLFIIPIGLLIKRIGR